MKSNIITQEELIKLKQEEFNHVKETGFIFRTPENENSIKLLDVESIELERLTYTYFINFTMFSGDRNRWVFASKEKDNNKRATEVYDKLMYFLNLNSTIL